MHPELERFYSILAMLESRPTQGRRLADYTGRSPWPPRGVYFFREADEQRTSRSDVARVVRVGTHAVSANSKSTLWNRLRAHRGGLAGGGIIAGQSFGYTSEQRCLLGMADSFRRGAWDRPPAAQYALERSITSGVSRRTSATCRCSGWTCPMNPDR